MAFALKSQKLNQQIQKLYELLSESSFQWRAQHPALVAVRALPGGQRHSAASAPSWFLEEEEHGCEADE